MSKFAIFGDSTCDLTRDLREAAGVDYVPMDVSWEGEPVEGVKWDGSEIHADLDWEAGVTIEEYAKILKAGRRIMTSQVTTQSLLEKFEPVLEKGEDILYIACSSALSASVKLAEKLSGELEAKYPGRKVVAFDSLCSTACQGMMVCRAAALRDAGKTLDEVVEILYKERLKYNQFAAIDDLNYLKRAGRVKASSAFFGNLFGVKPIVISDAAGNNAANHKEKGRKNSLLYIAKAAVEACEDIENSTIVISQFDCMDAAEIVKAEILKLAKPKEIAIRNLGPIIGASTGPGTISTFCFGKEVTFVAEK
ncbi:MAG: DegV family protein [Bacilli bacterium]|nr:DegV family protein [Bacilli bacterium]